MNWDKVVNLTKQKAKAIVNEHGAVGVQYAFMDSGKIVFSGNVGYKDKKGEKNISSDTIYGIGSITKLFTTTAVMQLVESGKLHLDEKLMHYIPEFKMQDERYKEITIHMLLNHSAGLMFYGKDNVTFGKANRNYMEQLLDVIGKQHLDRVPGSSSSYCNTGFDLLALVVERVNGLSFLEYLKKNIIIPLQLEDTKTNEEITEISNMAIPFLAKQGIEMPLEYANCIGSGGLYSTAEDLCRFGMTFTDSGNEILSEKSVKAMMEEQSSELPWDALENRDRFGLGFDTVKKHPFHEYGIQVISKGGSTTSYGSFLAVVPEYNLVMAFMSNGGNPLANEVAVINILMTALSEKGVLKNIQANHKKILSDDEFEIEDKYKIYAGYYANADNNYRITFEQNKMFMEILEPSYSMEFIYKGNGFFYSEDGNNYRFFVEAHNGKKYIAASDEWSIQDIGCYKYEFYEAQKVDEKKITADLWNIWKMRSGMINYQLNGSFHSSIYRYHFKFLLPSIPYSLGKKYTEDKCMTIAEVPGHCGREIVEQEFYIENGIEYVRYTSGEIMRVSEPKNINTIGQVVIKDNGYAEWRNIPVKYVGMTMKVEIPKEGSMWLYDENIEFLTTSLSGNCNLFKIDGNERKVVFVGFPQTVFKYSFIL